MNLFGLAGLFALQIASAIHGALLAVGRLRLTSGLTLRAVGSRQSRITGALLVIGQLLGLLFALKIGHSLTLVVAPVAVAVVLGLILDRLVPDGAPESSEGI